MMISNIRNTAVDLRDQYEKLYENTVLSDDIIETIVSEYAMSLPWLKNYDIEEATQQKRILSKTLKWSSDYNRKQL